MATTCRDVMKTDVECCAADHTAQCAAKEMRDGNLGFIPICDEDKRVLGVVTDRDLAIRLVAGALLGCLVVENAVHQRVFDVEHLTAAVVGMAPQASGLHWGRRVPSSSTGSNHTRIGMPATSSGRPGR